MAVFPGRRTAANGVVEANRRANGRPPRTGPLTHLRDEEPIARACSSTRRYIGRCDACLGQGDAEFSSARLRSWRKPH
jgi:hypothetical protein